MIENEIRLKFEFLPPSVNEAYSWYYKRHKSPVYLEFLRNLDDYFLLHDKKYNIKGDQWLAVEYVFSFPIYYKNGKIKKIDLANFEKTLTDGLTHFIPGFKDENIKILKMEKINWDPATYILIKEII